MTTAIFSNCGLRETEQLGELLAELLPDQTVVSLCGTLGAGKTKLVQAIARGCGIDPLEVTSPTFVLCQEYHGRRSLFHFDAYRLNSSAEFQALGPDEYFQAPGITLIEWGDRVVEYLPTERLEIQIEVTGDETREFEIRGSGVCLAAVVETLQSRLSLRESTDFRGAKDDLHTDDETIIAAEVVPETPPVRLPAPPRIWTALVVASLSIPMAAAISTAFVVAFMIFDLGVPQMTNPRRIESWITDFTKTRIGLLVLVLPGQFSFLALALGAAFFSPQRWPERLQLREGNLPMWTWPVFALGTPFIGMVTSILLSLVFTDMGEHLELLNNLFRSHHGLFTLVIVATVAFLPGLSEELLFRGYVQSRLLQRLPPAVAIGLSSLLFSVAHLDPIHVLAVIPLGVWLGILAWRAASIWPSVLCHAVNNSVAIVMTQASAGDGLEPDWDAVTVTLFALSLLAMCASVFLLVRAKRHV